MIEDAPKLELVSEPERVMPSEPSPFVAPPKPKRRSLFAPKEPKIAKPKAEIALRKGDNSEGLSMVYVWAGGAVSDWEQRQGRLGAVGRSMQFTAPTAGRLLADGAKRFPVAHNLLISLLGTGAGIRDASAVIGIPILVRRMERDPLSIPGTLPILRAQIRPVLRDMLKAAKEQAKVARELAQLEMDLQGETGQPFSIDEMILVGMLGLPPEVATQILSGTPIAQVLRTQPEPEPAASPDLSSVG